VNKAKNINLTASRLCWEKKTVASQIIIIIVVVVVAVIIIITIIFITTRVIVSCENATNRLTMALLCTVTHFDVSSSICETLRVFASVSFLEKIATKRVSEHCSI
jgi:hypothetical protein